MLKIKPVSVWIYTTYKAVWNNVNDAKEQESIYLKDLKKYDKHKITQKEARYLK